MPGLFIYTSNYLEKLSLQLAELLASPLDTPLTPEVVVVHSKGMGQWLAMEVAGYNGICANTVFPFPNAFLDWLYDSANIQTFKNTSEQSPYVPDVMTFKIMKMLPECLAREQFKSLKHYLSADNQFRLFQLSEQIGETFDQYLTFRPDMIYEWEKGRSDQWQAHLWREISKGTEGIHRAGQRKLLLEKIRSGRDCLPSIPMRISFFGISYLPPFHLEIMTALAEIRDVHLFVINPCCEYWGDIVSDKEKKRIKKRYDSDVASDNNLYLETGNPLLSSWGTMGRDFLDMIQTFEGQTMERYQEIGDEDMLSAVQSDLLYLRDRSATPASLHPKGKETENNKKDKSVQIHSCHSPLREIEVLHNHLLAMFEEDKGLLPKDILIMAPDITSYEPFIHAVFGGQTDERRKIPYHISDKRFLKESPVIKGFLRLLDLPGGRFGVSQIMAMLDIPGIKEKFGLSVSDIPLIETWITDTNIRWGIDASHKGRMGLPEMEENTWKAAFQRLLLGYAMPGRHRELFNGILPYDNMEGSETLVLGYFLNLFEALVGLIEVLHKEKTLDLWAKTLNKILEDFFLTEDPSEEDKQILRAVFDDLSQYQEISGNDLEIHLRVIMSFLEKRLSSNNPSTGFVTGNVTFCTLLPFRSIPAKIICLIGMNGSAFPRDYFRPSFDITAQSPKPGDRIKRNDDKYLFLQALLSARQRFYISYVGQSNRDNSIIPPCVMVSELTDYLRKGFGLPENQIIVRHRLQAFSEAYFKPSEDLFSYSREDFETCVTAQNRGKRSKIELGIIDEKLAEPDVDFRRVDMDKLGYFYTNPCKFLMEERLGIYLEDELWTFEEEEPFSLGGLNRYQVGQDIVADRLSGFSINHIGKVQRALGRLPHGTSGDVFFLEETNEAQSYIDKIQAYESSEQLEPLDVEVAIGKFVLTGKLKNIHKAFCFNRVYAKSKSKYLLRSWINHLVLCMAQEKGYPQNTILACKDVTWQFSPVEISREILEDLLLVYWQGLMLPAVFFPESSSHYAEMVLKKKSTEKEALRSSARKWLGNDFSMGEGQDTYTRLCFPGSPFDNETQQNVFKETAIRVLSPLFQHCQKVTSEP